ncbi:glycoside/pentoside/hexuronide:cation symporter, GPH family [Parapedobacter composti]|uniref:Glycoside/pentoside/hexuronide:cation symporter, GPH family n=1 Tax=Parapedobacter composti TaxID=623281 RepID=A0A1I1L7Q0_9SPHI|nr:MFS transporter [Parapedobacter composti]SFC69046.1 glycoside/pentoside/hexuronide:cation symporter, GPH family [Parapedobacter composti]
MNIPASKVTVREKIGYGLGDAASSMFWKLFGMYLMFFYTDIFGLEASVVGTMFLVTRVWDSLVDPVIGAIADRTGSRFGKFRPYILYVAVPFGVMGVITFYTPDFGSTGKIVYAYVTYSVMMMVYSAINVPYASLLGVISPSPSVRSVLATFRMTFAYIGSFVTLLLFNPLVAYFSNYSGDISQQRYGWFMGATVMAVCCVILFFLCFLWTKERVQPVMGSSSTLKEDVRDLLNNRPWWILLFASICTLVFNSVRDGAALYYFKYYVEEQQFAQVRIFGIPFVWSGLYLSVGQIANIAGVILAAPVSNVVGKKRTYIIAMALAAVASIAFYWLAPTAIYGIFFLQILISTCAGTVFPLLWSMCADCVDYSELRTGNRATGLIFSSSSMSQKLGWAFGTAVTGWLLGYFGFQANQTQSVETLSGIRMFLSFFPAIGAALAAFFIVLYPLNEQRMNEIALQLSGRRNG